MKLIWVILGVTAVAALKHPFSLRLVARKKQFITEWPPSVAIPVGLSGGKNREEKRCWMELLASLSSTLL